MTYLLFSLNNCHCWWYTLISYPHEIWVNSSNHSWSSAWLSAFRGNICTVTVLLNVPGWHINIDLNCGNYLFMWMDMTPKIEWPKIFCSQCLCQFLTKLISANPKLSSWKGHPEMSSSSRGRGYSGYTAESKIRNAPSSWYIYIYIIYILLYYITLYYIILYYVILYYYITILYYIILYYIIFNDFTTGFCFPSSVSWLCQMDAVENARPCIERPGSCSRPAERQRMWPAVSL